MNDCCTISYLYINLQILGKGGGGALVFQGGYHPCKWKHKIRVVFQNQAIYVHTSFRGAKMSKRGEKGCVLVINFGEKSMAEN